MAVPVFATHTMVPHDEKLLRLNTGRLSQAKLLCVILSFRCITSNTSTKPRPIGTAEMQPIECLFSPLLTCPVESKCTLFIEPYQYEYTS